MTIPMPDSGIDPSIATATAAFSVGSPQHGAPTDDNQKKLALPEMSNQMIPLK